jgi:hypothetical protein
MAIPTAFDRELADVENAASAVTLCLRTLQHADARTVPAMRRTLAQRPRTFVDLAMDAARPIDG